MSILLYPIFLPIVIGIVMLLIGRRGLKASLPVITTFIVLILSIVLFSAGEINYTIPWLSFGIDFSLRAYSFSAMCVLFSSLFAFLICLYLLPSTFYLLPSFILINLGVVNGALLSNNFVIFVLFWELAAIMLYLLIRTQNRYEIPQARHGTDTESSVSVPCKVQSQFCDSYKTATKALYIIGFSDFCLLLGIILLWNLTKTFNMSKIHNLLPSTFYLLPFTCLCIGALAKAGAMPFHTWIPDASKDAPVEVMAYLPASLDKLLGIYLLVRICTDFFNCQLSIVNCQLVLMFLGAFTIIAAVFMALVQHDLKKMIAYMNISGAGYMVLGIGTNTPIGIAGGLFYMLGTVLWTSCLFLCSGSVEKQTGTTELDKLGGLSKVMPITFWATLIAALSISGVPPFNGFFSKWLIYQGLIQQIADSRWQIAVVLFLVAAMFGSALTLASFIKLIHSTFLGKPSTVNRQPSTDVSWTMWFPTVILAVLCIIFGIFAYQIPLKHFIFPSIRFAHPPINWGAFSGLWHPDLATLLIIVGIILGLIIYLLGTIKTIRKTETYIYGESPEIFTEGFQGTEFYLTISNSKPFASIYKKAEKGILDFYNWAFNIAKMVANSFFICIDRMLENIYIGIDRLTAIVSTFTSELQGGLLQIYLYWSLFGLMILLFMLCR
ncbi:MAG: proton-conducting transporter membrane subunit [Elusimicrobiota bacterium]